MSKIVVYPRLFTSHDRGEVGVVVSAGDVIVDRLFIDTFSGRANVETWAFRKEVVDCAIRLFGDFEHWLEDQRKNPKIVGYNLEFIADTLRFIRTGQRKQSFNVWNLLVAEANDPIRHPSNDRATLADLHPLDDENGLGYLEKWLTKPNGVTDLIQTLHVLFGHSRDANL